MSDVNDPAARLQLVFKFSNFLKTESFFVKLAFFVKFSLFCEISQSHTHWIFLLKEIWLLDHKLLQTIWQFCGLCVNFFPGDHTHFWPHPLFHFTRGWLSYNSSYERRIALILGKVMAILSSRMVVRREKCYQIVPYTMVKNFEPYRTYQWRNRLVTIFFADEIQMPLTNPNHNSLVPLYMS